MTEIFVGGLPAVMAEGSEVEYAAVNPLFSEDAEGYTLSIEFPMCGCPENRRIFGHMERADFDKEEELLGCVIRVGGMELRGSLAVLEVNEGMVKGQFLEGVRPEEEELAVERLKVNELDLGVYPETDPKKITPYDATQGRGDAVCMPWIAEGYTVVNNRSVSKTQWHEETRELSWQPLLLPLVRRIAEAAGYTVDLSAADGTYWEDAVVCNSLPGVWGLTGYADALPAWTVAEWFEKLGKYMKGVFEMDHSKRTIKFDFLSELQRRAGVVEVEVVDEYTSAVTRDEEDADFLSLMNYRYPTSSMEIWKWLDCPGILEGNWGVSRYATLDELLDSLGKYEIDDKGHRHPVNGNGGPLYYAEDIDTYFAFRKVVVYSEGWVRKELSDKYRYLHFTTLQPVNVFAPRRWDKEGDVDYEELEVAPVCVDWAFEGQVMWLPVGTYSEEEGDADSLVGSGDTDWGDFKNTIVSSTGQILTSRAVAYNLSRIEGAIRNYDEESGTSAYYDRVYIGIRNPNSERRVPVTDVDCYLGRFDNLQHFFRLDEGGAGETIDPRVKYSFTLVCRGQLPDKNAIFIIGGKRYVCRKLRATFTAEGMHPLVKGEFYRVN